jgi:drug/metabolite transporter (DMT)-like permease
MEESTKLGPGAAALAVCCCAFWGANTVAVKFTVLHIPPVGCAGLRFLGSLAVIAAWCRLDGTSLRFQWRDFWPLAVNAVLTFFQMAAFNWGTAHTHAGRSSVFLNVHPFVVAPLALLWLGEPVGWRAIVGLALAGGGVAVLFDQSPGASAGASPAGDMAVLVSGALIGAGTVYQKVLLARMKPNYLLFWQMALAVPLFLMYSGCAEGFETYRFNAESLAGLAFQSLLVSGFCFIVWMALLRRYPANQLAAFGFLTPCFGIACGHMCRGEPLGISVLAGCGLVGVGLYLVTRP